MKLAGPSLFFLGILVAISGSAKLPAAGATYPDTTAIFLVGMILAIVGTVLWRRALRHSTVPTIARIIPTRKIAVVSG